MQVISSVVLSHTASFPLFPANAKLFHPRTHQSGPLQQPGVWMEKEPNKFGVFTKVPNLPLIKITWNKESDAFGKPPKALSVQITPKIERKSCI